MLLTAKSRSDYIRKLIKVLKNEVESIKEPQCEFFRKIDIIKFLNKINCNFYTNKNGEIEPMWNEDAKPIEFKNKESLFDEIEINYIKSRNELKAMVLITIEQVLRDIFFNKEARLLCRELIRGDEILRNILRDLLTFSETVEFQRGDEYQCIIFPCSQQKDCKIFVDQNLEQVYENSASELLIMLGLVFESNLMPIGNYQIKNHREEAEEIPYEVSQGNWKFTIEALYETYRPYPDEDLLEIMYNSSLGMVKSLSNKHMEEIREYIDKYSNNPLMLRKLLCVLLASNFPRELNDDVIECSNTILKFLNSDINTEFLKGLFSSPQKILSRNFYALIKKLSNATLFQLAENPNLINLADEQGILQENLHRYILKEQIERFKRSPKLDMTIKSLFNSINTEKKEMLLWILFSDS